MTPRVRYAPSPTGLQHIGGVRTALFDYLYARRTGGTFVLRIEDTDQGRYDDASLQDIYDTFDWLGFRWDEGPDTGGPYGPYIQTERAELYRKYADELLASGHAYYAFDTAEELQAQREESDGKSGYDRKFRDMSDSELDTYRARGIPPVVRLRVPLAGTTTVRDVVLGEMTWANEDVSPDPVLLKSDGLPTYHLANVVDDHHMEITHILRAQEWLPSAPLHAILYAAFGWEPPVFCHLPMVVGEDGKKLSKRHGAASALQFRQQGYLPKAMINYLVRLGWSYDDKQEIFSLDDLVKVFSLEKIAKAPAVFDYKKLDWLNGYYIREMSHDELFDAILPFVREAGLISSDDRLSTLRESVPLIQERLRVLSDAPDLVRFVFEEPEGYDPAELIPKKADRESTLSLLRAARSLVGRIPDQDDDANEQAFRTAADELGTKLGNLMMPLRVAVTGSRVSPPLFGSIRLIGKERAERRIDYAIGLLESGDPK